MFNFKQNKEIKKLQLEHDQLISDNNKHIDKTLLINDLSLIYMFLCDNFSDLLANKMNLRILNSDLKTLHNEQITTNKKIIVENNCIKIVDNKNV